MLRKKTYLLRTINPELWSRVKAQAQRDGISLRGLILRLLELYITGRVGVPWCPPSRESIPRRPSRTPRKEERAAHRA